MKPIRVSKAIKVIKVLLRNPRCLARILDEEPDAELDEEGKKKEYVIKRYGYEYGLPTIDLLDVFPNFQETVEPYSFLEGSAFPLDLALLRALARKYDHCRYLEIGTYRGESVANVAAIADKCASISLSDDEMRGMGLSNDFIRVHRFFSENCRNVHHIGCDSRKFDFSGLNEEFDLIFIDGDHSYETVKTDTENAFRLLRDSNSVIVWHDYGFSPETVRWSILAAILDGTPEKKRNNLYHISNTMCAVYVLGNFDTSFTIFPQIPNKNFTIRISTTRL